MVTIFVVLFKLHHLPKQRVNRRRLAAGTRPRKEQRARRRVIISAGVHDKRLEAQRLQRIKIQRVAQQPDHRLLALDRRHRGERAARPQDVFSMSMRPSCGTSLRYTTRSARTLIPRVDLRLKFPRNQRALL